MRPPFRIYDHALMQIIKAQRCFFAHIVIRVVADADQFEQPQIGIHSHYIEAFRAARSLDPAAVAVCENRHAHSSRIAR